MPEITHNAIHYLSAINVAHTRSRMGDYRANVSVDGRVLQNVSGGVDYTINVGDILEINGDKIVITNCSYSGQAKGFHSLSISGTAYSGIPTLAPKGVS